MNDLTTFEIQILQEIAGLRKPSNWGAAVSVALESLHKNGYITSVLNGELTELGKKVIQRL